MVAYFMFKIMQKIIENFKLYDCLKMIEPKIDNIL